MSHFIVGLTGGIGSGKTSVADRFAEQGVTIIDTDAIAHELTGVQGAALPHIEAVFGRAVLLDTGELNRVAMRRLVFVATELPTFFLAFPSDELTDDLADVLLGDDHALDADKVR